MVDVQCLSNCDLQIHLEQLGFSPGPILQLNIILKGNITLITEKDKESKNRLKAYFGKTRVVDVSCFAQMPARQIRSATPSLDTIQKQDYCKVTKSIDKQFPMGLRLAVLGIFIIVVFVYITVENRPLLA
ncbi:LEM domain-containing protein 1 isoform 2-T2 [Thomomys bottae]